MERLRRVRACAALLVGSVGLLGACGTTSVNPSPPSRTAAAPSESATVTSLADEAFTALDTKELVQGSRFVVKAHVTSAEPADSIAYGEEGRTQFEFLELHIDEVLYTSASSPMPATEMTLRQVATIGGRETTVNGLTRAQVDDVGYFFLVPSSVAENSWRLVSTQGQYTIDPNGRLRGARRDDPVVKTIETMSPTELERYVRSVVPKAISPTS